MRPATFGRPLAVVDVLPEKGRVVPRTRQPVADRVVHVPVRAAEGGDGGDVAVHLVAVVVGVPAEEQRGARGTADGHRGDVVLRAAGAASVSAAAAGLRGSCRQSRGSHLEVNAALLEVLGQRGHDRGVVLLPVRVQVVRHHEPAKGQRPGDREDHSRSVTRAQGGREAAAGAINLNL